MNDQEQLTLVVLWHFPEVKLECRHVETLCRIESSANRRSIHPRDRPCSHGTSSSRVEYLRRNLSTLFRQIKSTLTEEFGRRCFFSTTLISSLYWHTTSSNRCHVRLCWCCCCCCCCCCWHHFLAELLLNNLHFCQFCLNSTIAKGNSHSYVLIATASDLLSKK